MEELRRQLQKGTIREAYRSLLSFMLGLRTHLSRRLPVSGLYQGYMDMSYFALFPPALKRLNLKIAIVFKYDTFRFEVWLSAGNKKVQKQYWQLLRAGSWPRYRVVTPGKGIDSILECDLATGLDLVDPDALTAHVEKVTLAFIDEVETFLAR
jgi:hypothetical protein